MDPFLKTVEARVPVATVLGAAPSVVGAGEPMRPDRNYTTLKWLSTLGGIFGLDHFYLRNPFSGVLKLITGGGFLIWWLWDAAQLWTEKDRVLRYGMTAPFDIMSGFGQGTIADGPSHYKQRSDSAWWMLAAVFSFLGADSMLLGNWGQMLRKLTEIAMFALMVVPLVVAWRDAGIFGILTFRNIFRGLIAALIGYIVISEWASVAGASLGDPANLFSRGIHVSRKQDDILNFPKAWVKNIWLFGPEIQEQIMKDIGYRSISGAEMRRSFEVRYTTAESDAAEAAAEDAAAAAAAAAASQTSSIRWHWLLSYLVYLFGPILWAIQLIVGAILWIVKRMFRATPAGVAAAAAEQVMQQGQAVAEQVEGAKQGALGHIAETAQRTASHSVLGHLGSIAEQVEGAKQGVLGHSAEAAQRTASQGVLGHLGSVAAKTMRHTENQQGGAHEGPSTQSMIMGATVFALAGGSAIKLAVDYLFPAAEN